MLSRRFEYGLTGLFLGFFASAWFGWGNAAAPAWLEPWLIVGSVLSLAAAATGAVVAVRNRRTARPRDPAFNRRYGILVGIEFGVAFVGAAILGIAGQADYIPVWVCAVVGVHFFPLAPVLDDRGLVPLGVVVTAIAVVALVVGLATDTAPGTVTGVGAGVALLAYALSGLVRAAAPATP